MEENRKIGLDILKIISMMMIILLHILGHGEVLNSLEFLSTKYEVFWFIETACYCAVNCYAIITGYLLYKKEFKLSRIINIWIQVIFYTIGIMTIFAILKPDSINQDIILYSVFPFTFKSYWYFTSYMVVLLLFPFINKLIDVLDKRQYKILLIILVTCFSIAPTIPVKDITSTAWGYSPLWLTILYIIGAYIKKYQNDDKIKLRYLAYYIVAVLAVFISKYIIEKYNVQIFSAKDSGNYLLTYISPFILWSAVSLVKFMLPIKCKNKYLIKIATIFSTSTFGVYLLHENILLRNLFIRGKFTEYTDLRILKLLFVVFAAMLVVYSITTIIEIIRKNIFKLCRVPKLIGHIEKSYMIAVNKRVVEQTKL